MKFISLAIFFLSLQVFAQGGGDHVSNGGPRSATPLPPLFSVEHPGSPMMRIPIYVKVSLFADGSVVKQTTRESKTTYEAILKINDLSDVNKCASELYGKDVDTNIHVPCMDDSGIIYRGMYDKNIFAFRVCGEIHQVNIPCSEKMVKLMDTLYNLSLE